MSKTTKNRSPKDLEAVAKVEELKQSDLKPSDTVNASNASKLNNIIYLKPTELTLFERVEMLSTRAIELQRDKEPLVEVGDITDPRKIAIMEFWKGVIPYIVIRRYPSGKEDFIKLSKQ